jgi:hypothetical protein
MPSGHPYEMVYFAKLVLTFRNDTEVVPYNILIKMPYIKQQKAVHCCTAFARGLDKEMGMSGIDAYAS